MIKLIYAAIQVYLVHLKWRHRIYIYELEDEIDKLAADGSPAAKLRIERLAERLRFERERIVGPSDSDSD